VAKYYGRKNFTFSSLLQMVGWSLTSIFSRNTAISETTLLRMIEVIYSIFFNFVQFSEHWRVKCGAK